MIKVPLTSDTKSFWEWVYAKQPAYFAQTSVTQPRPELIPKRPSLGGRPSTMYGNFRRFPLLQYDVAIWSFNTLEFRDAFVKAYSAEIWSP